MFNPYDSATKALIEERPADWLGLAGFAPRGPIEVINADLTTITSAADKVLRIDDPIPWIANFELQSNRDPFLAYRLLRYNALLTARHLIPTRSLLVLLRPEADGPELTGRLWVPPSIDFTYSVLRVWQLPLGRLLNGGLGTLPLAPLADLGPTSPRAVMDVLERRIRSDCPPAHADDLWAATWLLLGLRFDDATSAALIEGILEMKESRTYQLAVAEGVNQGSLAEARAFVLRLGRKRFGPPSPAMLAAIQSMTDREQIERIGERLLDCPSWDAALRNDP